MQLFHEKNPSPEDILTAITIVEGVMTSTAASEVVAASISTTEENGEAVLTITIESNDSEEALRRSLEQLSVYINGLNEAMTDAVATRKELEEMLG